MKHNTKDVVKMGLLVFIYALLGIIGIYSSTVMILLPLLAVPMTIYLLSSSAKTVKQDVLLNGMIVLIIYLLTGSLPEVILYMLNVIVPAYVVAYLYKKNTPIPQVVMYTGTAIAGALFVCIIGLQSLGVDYIQYYFETLDMYQSIQVEIFGTMGQYGLNGDQLNVLKELIATQVEVMKMAYPAIFFILILWGVVVQLSIVTIIGKIKKWRLPRLRGLAHFKLSRITILLFILSFGLMQGSAMAGSPWSILGWNIFFLVNSLYQFVGIISVVVLIKGLKVNKVAKTLCGIFMLVLMYSSPSMLMLFGLLDTMFNYRKVKNVV